MAMNEKEFALRIAKLRQQRGVSARDMSLSIGQNPGYINNIETGKMKPSLSGFFYICEYLNISAKDFFDYENKFPSKIKDLEENLKKLDESQLDNLSEIVKSMIK